MWIVSSIAYGAKSLLDNITEVHVAVKDFMTLRRYTFSAGTRELKCIQKLLKDWGLATVCPSVVMAMYRLNSGRDGSLWEADKDAFTAESWSVTAYFHADGTMSFTKIRTGLGCGACDVAWYKGELTLTLRCSASTETKLLRVMCSAENAYDPYDPCSDRYLQHDTPRTASWSSTSCTPLLGP
jgi:hypothetical protein